VSGRAAGAYQIGRNHCFAMAWFEGMEGAKANRSGQGQANNAKAQLRCGDQLCEGVSWCGLPVSLEWQGWGGQRLP
jgi:hypothetical protein